jgi:hypothetical protein
MILIILGILLIFVGVLCAGVSLVFWPLIVVGAVGFLAYKAGKKKGGDKE